MSVHLINFVHTFYLYVFLLYEQTLSVALCVQFFLCLYKNKKHEKLLLWIEIVFGYFAFLSIK